MWRKFKWDMFVTSFIPLWLSIIVIDAWNTVCFIIKGCRQSVVKIQKCLFCPCAKNEKCPKLGHFFGCGGRILILDTDLPADTVRI